MPTCKHRGIGLMCSLTRCDDFVPTVMMFSHQQDEIDEVTECMAKLATATTRLVEVLKAVVDDSSSISEVGAALPVRIAELQAALLDAEKVDEE